MQCLCIGSDSNDGDILLMKVMVNWQTHGHHKPHPQALSGQKKKKQPIYSCWTAPFVFSMNEKEHYISQRSLGPLAE